MTHATRTVRTCLDSYIAHKAWWPHELRRPRRTQPAGHPRPAARRRADRQRAGRATRPQPARLVQAPAGAARRRPGQGAGGRSAALLPPAPGAARRDRRLAGAVPPAVDAPARRPRTPPGGESMSTSGDLLTIDGRATLRFERHYRYAVERVWRAVTEPSEMAAWFPSQVIGDRVVGADLIFDDDAKRAAARAAGEPTRDDGPWFHGTVVAFEPPTLFEFTWGGELLRIELTPEGDGTRMVFSQVVSHPSVAARNGASWHVCLTELDALLDPPARRAGDGDSDSDSDSDGAGDSGAW